MLTRELIRISIAFFIGAFIGLITMSSFKDGILLGIYIVSLVYSLDVILNFLRKVLVGWFQYQLYGMLFRSIVVMILTTVFLLIALSAMIMIIPIIGITRVITRVYRAVNLDEQFKGL